VSEIFLDEKQNKKLRKYSANISFGGDGLELYQSSKKENESNYTNVDLYVFLKYAQDKNMDFLSLLRFLVSKLSSHIDIIKEIEEHGEDCKIREELIESNSPVSGLSSFFSSTKSSVSVNYADFLLSMLESDIPYALVEEDKNEILSLLSGKSKEENVFCEGTTRVDASQKDIEDFFETISPLVLAMSEVRFGNKEEAEEKIERLSKALDFRKILLPATEEKITPLTKNQKVSAEEAAHKVLVKLKLKFNKKGISNEKN